MFLTLPSGERLAYDHRPGLNGTLALWLHGFSSSRRGGKAVTLGARLSAAGYGWAAFDFRGHGGSDGSLHTLTGTRHLEDAHLALTELGRDYDRIALIGSSLGGWAAAWTALRAGSRIHRLALLAPALHLRGQRHALAAAQLAGWTQLAPGAVRSKRPDLVADLERYDEAELTRSLAVPTLIVHGMRDTVVPWRGSVAFAEACKQSRVELLLFNDADHSLQSRLPAIGDALLGFLAR